MEIEWSGPVLVALVAAVPGILAWANQRKKVGADAAASLARAASDLAGDLRQEIDYLRQCVDDAEKREQELRQQVATLQETLDMTIRRVNELEHENRVLREDNRRLGARVGSMGVGSRE